MDVGATLRHARTRKGLTLEQLARATKINLHQLEALEMNDFDRLPANIYTRGFLRAYAREVDLDPEAIVDDYLEQEVQSQPVPSAPSRSLDAPRVVIVPTDLFRAYAPVFRVDRLPDWLTTNRHAMPLAAAAIVGLLLVLYVAAASRRGQTEAVATVQPASESPSRAAGAPTAIDATRAANVTAEALRIDVKVNGLCWLSATADRTPVIARLLQRGEHQSFDARDEIVMRVGDPAAVAIAINGVPARSLGGPHRAVTVQINRQNYRDFLEP